jgi:hypothetical protein
MVGLEPGQAGVQSVPDVVRPAHAGDEDPLRVLVPSELGRQDDIVAALLQRSADQALAGPVAVDVGGADERDAGVQGGQERRGGIAFLDAAVDGRQGHRAESQDRHPQPARSKGAITHYESPLYLSWMCFHSARSLTGQPVHTDD